MNAKRLVVGTLVGGVVLYVVGYVIFTRAFAAFYAANAGTATGVDRGGELFWAVALANLAYAALVTFAMGNRADSLSIVRRRHDRSDRGFSSVGYCGLHLLRHHKHRELDEDGRGPSPRDRARRPRRRRHRGGAEGNACVGS